MTYTVYAKRKGKRDIIFDPKTKEIIDNGQNEVLTVWSKCPKLDTAERFAKNLLEKKDVGIWKTWVEQD